MADVGVQIDHVVIGVRDLDHAAAEFDDRYGLTAIEGGRHPGWGTANRLVPLGAAYLELVTVADQAEAASSEFGRWVSAMMDGQSGWGWAVRTDNLDDTAARLALEVVAGSRLSRSGATLQWRIAGVAQAAQEPWLPFFIQWGLDTPLPGRAPAVHHAGAVALEELVIEGDEERLHAWLGTTSLPLQVTPGTRGLTSFTITTPTNAIVVSSDD